MAGSERDGERLRARGGFTAPAAAASDSRGAADVGATLASASKSGRGQNRQRTSRGRQKENSRPRRRRGRLVRRPFGAWKRRCRIKASAVPTLDHGATNRNFASRDRSRVASGIRLARKNRVRIGRTAASQHCAFAQPIRLYGLRRLQRRLRRAESISAIFSFRSRCALPQPFESSYLL